MLNSGRQFSTDIGFSRRRRRRRRRLSDDVRSCQFYRQRRLSHFDLESPIIKKHYIPKEPLSAFPLRTRIVNVGKNWNMT